MPTDYSEQKRTEQANSWSTFIQIQQTLKDYQYSAALDPVLFSRGKKEK